MKEQLHLSEVIIPGAGRSSGVKSFLLTRPSAGGGVSVFFGLFAADAPRKVVEKIAERAAEASAPTFFDGVSDMEQRYESALKQANKAVLNVLHEQRLSLPGIKLRGIIGACENGRLMVSNRGSMRGVALFPKGGTMTGIRLFQEGPDTSTNPKFFSSFQSGALPPGSRVVLATGELFQAVDEPFLRDLFGREAPAAAARALKQKARGRALAAALTLAVPPDDLEPIAESRAASPPDPVRKGPVRPARRGEPAGLDIGELGAKTVEGAFVLAWNGLKAVPGGLAAGVRSAAVLARFLFRLPVLLGRVDWKNAHRAAYERAASRFRTMPKRSRAYLVLLVLVSAVFLHGLVWTLGRHSAALAARAYEAKLAEIEQLKTELETSLIIGNDRRSHDVLARLAAAVEALPAANEAERRARSGADAFLEAKRSALRRIVTIADPMRLAEFEDMTGAYASATLAWFDRKVHIFSATEPSVMSIGPDGSASETTFANAPGPVASAAPARTGLLLRFSDGQVGFWNASASDVFLYPAFSADSPILFYESRLYSMRPDGMLERRPVLNRQLGSPADVLQAPTDLSAVSSIAADGAAYLLSPKGEVRKYMKGIPSESFRAPAIDPPISDAVGLWADPGSPWLVFAERGGGRIVVLDASSGKLAAQMTSPAFSPVIGAAVDAKGQEIAVLSGRTVYVVPLKPAVK